MDLDYYIKEYNAKEITNAKCIYCGGSVEPRVAIERVFVGHEKREALLPAIYSYWVCEKCGKVTWADINGKLYEKPLQLFNELILRDWANKKVKKLGGLGNDFEGGGVFEKPHDGRRGERVLKADFTG